MVDVASLNRALRHVVRELDAVGLWHGRLESVEVVLTYWPAGWWGVSGFVYDQGVGGIAALAGFREQTIYIPANAPVSRRRGHSLRDVIRHEYGHALSSIEPSFVDGEWFADAFGARYDDEWDEAPRYDSEAFVSAYATTRPSEDFAESFAVWLGERLSSPRAHVGAAARRKIDAIERRVRGLRRSVIVLGQEHLRS